MKVSEWAAATSIDVVVRSQPSIVEQREEGLVKFEIILILTKTAVAMKDVILWNSKYYNVIMVEPVYWKSTIQYYKCTCQEMIEWLGN